jgi:GT2 family glycosyltransferase
MECLVSIKSTLMPSIPIELIIADDASPEIEIQRVASIPGIRYFRNQHNMGFIRNCNEAAKKAVSPYLLFLNSDVVVFGEWLSELVTFIRSDKRIGSVGPMLVNDDGSVQECGSNLAENYRIVCLSASIYPNDPAYSFPAKVDFCSGACLLTRRELFEKVEGFSEYLKGAYYDDIDYALKLKKLGYSSWVVPSAKVLHHAHSSYKTEEQRNTLEYNRKICLSKWGEVLKPTL